MYMDSAPYRAQLGGVFLMATDIELMPTQELASAEAGRDVRTLSSSPIIGEERPQCLEAAAATVQQTATVATPQ